MKLRSLLFVPADRPERFAKAVASSADALILDLEDAVSTDRRPFAREAIAEWLGGERPVPTFVRINPIGSDMVRDDLEAILPHRPDGIVLPKAEGAKSVRALLAFDSDLPIPPILPIATETPAALFELGSFREVAGQIAGLTWGSEDLPAAIGAVTARDYEGAYLPPYELARSLTLFAAHAAGVAAIETVFPAFHDLEGLADYAARGARDGFTGMMAIHPSQVRLINAAFTPSREAVAHAQDVVAAFDARPGAAVLQLDGRMIDRPHLIQALRILEASGTLERN